MSELEALTRRAVWQKAILDEFGAEFERTKTALRNELGAGGRKWSVSDGDVDLGDAQLKKMKPKPEVDMARLVAHVIDDHPSELRWKHTMLPGVTLDQVAAALREYNVPLYQEFFTPDPVPTCSDAFRTAVTKNPECAGCVDSVSWVPVANPTLLVSPSHAVRVAATALLQGAELPELGGAA